MNNLKEEKEFIEYCENERNEFDKYFNQRMWGTELKTNKETLFIMLDQLIERRKKDLGIKNEEGIINVYEIPLTENVKNKNEKINIKSSVLDKIKFENR